VFENLRERARPWTWLAVALLGAFVLRWTMARFGAAMLLPALLGLEVLVFALWSFRARFFTLLLLAFFLAGTRTPLLGPFTMARWAVLAVGAAAGFVLYLRQRHASFGIFHWVGVCCILSALVSALVSIYGVVALLKTGSLALLFLYAATGARLAIRGREVQFLSGLLLMCELLAYGSALLYFVFRDPFFGNPNSLGATMGVVVIPALLWGVLISEGTPLYRRRIFALAVAIGLLFSSYSRAGIGAAAVSCLVLCLALRRYRLLAKGALLALVMATVVVIRAPMQGDDSDSLISAFIYKGKPETELLESRERPWQRTTEVIREHPWFGSGFGTSATNVDEVQEKPGVYSSNLATHREHGDSYLAIVQWMGLLGVAPFALLALLVAGSAIRVWLWAWRTASPFSPAIPIAAIVTAGLVHAAFEDWLFAVGYYLCVFFWSLAFALVDILPAPATSPARVRVALKPRPWPAGYRPAADPGR